VQPRMLNIKQAAAYLGTTVNVMRRLVWERRLPKFVLGQRLLFDMQDLDKFVEAEKAKLAA
jgi:excisionase family DNA binding protein